MHPTKRRREKIDRRVRVGRNRDVPGPKLESPKKVTTIRLPDDLKSELQAVAKAEKRSLAAVCVSFLRFALEAWHSERRK